MGAAMFRVNKDYCTLTFFPLSKGKRREAELGLTWYTWVVDLWLFSQIIAKKVIMFSIICYHVLFMLTLVVLRVDGFVVFIKMMIFINCANPVNSPLYIETGTCLNGVKSSNVSLLRRSYVNVGGMKASDLMELCSLERMTLLPVKDYKSMSYKEIHSQLAYGFELSWHYSMCGSCAYACYIDDSYNTHCIDRFSWLLITAGEDSISSLLHA
ncbi:receptor-like protein kinase [Populus alba x Populus x berolinensis]|uniref:Receptor-like protein kinase n=1 Tax=Populus alba x Populus x berolinensis TaxID=444605 RepID=A0AAD6VXI8_9ROSI|nr:receptor-like protein kinase [Populus alba x Populus x berolinensis]